MSTGRVRPGLEPGAGGVLPTSFVLWRAEPAAGTVYHRMAAVNPETGTYVDTDVRSGTTYLYAATGLASAEAEGPMSEPLRVVIPVVPGGQEGTRHGQQSSHFLLLWVVAGLAVLAIMAAASLAFVLVLRKRRHPPTP